MRARHLLPLIPVALALALPSGATAKTTVAAGDVFEIVTPGGGGYGVPGTLRSDD